jgi:hypothetical protein
MRRLFTRFLLSMLIPTATSLAFVVVAVPRPSMADTVCYANGTSYSLGSQQCLGGWVNVCTETGWALLGSGTRC